MSSKCLRLAREGRCHHIVWEIIFQTFKLVTEIREMRVKKKKKKKLKFHLYLWITVPLETYETRKWRRQVGGGDLDIYFV